MCGGWGVPEDDELSPDDGGCGKKKAVGDKVIGPSFDKGRRGFTSASLASRKSHSHKAAELASRDLAL